MYIVVFVLKRPFFVKLIYSCTFLYIVNSIDILLRKLMHIYVGLSRSSFVLEVTTITLISYRDCDNQMGIHENWNEKIKFFMNPKFCTSFWFSDKFNFVVWFWKKKCILSCITLYSMYNVYDNLFLTTKHTIRLKKISQ